VPGLLADHLRTADDEPIRQALASGQTIRRGHGYWVRITAPLALHCAAQEQNAALADAGVARRNRSEVSNPGRVVRS
jgi:putative DNA-invertase from lambdoid prophage Rac